MGWLITSTCLCHKHSWIQCKYCVSQISNLISAIKAAVLYRLGWGLLLVPMNFVGFTDEQIYFGLYCDSQYSFLILSDFHLSFPVMALVIAKREPGLYCNLEHHVKPGLMGMVVTCKDQGRFNCELGLFGERMEGDSAGSCGLRYIFSELSVCCVRSLLPRCCNSQGIPAVSGSFS